MKKHILNLPLSKEDITLLSAGDIAVLSGVLYTARDQAHQRFSETLKNGGALPLDLKTAALFYAGPSPAKKGEIIGSCGPTTSARMDSFTPLLIEHGLRVMVGKGKRSAAVNEAIQQYGAVYFAAIGGAGALYQQCVQACKLIAYPELGCEAVYELTVKDFEVVVATDCNGKTILK